MTAIRDRQTLEVVGAMLGTTFGRYEVVKHLARGGMADLWLARSSGIGGFERHSVIKQLLPVFAADAELVDMFVTEASLAGALHHHNIVQVHDTGQVDGRPYFAMEYVHGEDLRRLLVCLATRDEQLPLQHLIAIGAAAAAALHYAHEQRGTNQVPLGIVHRDVSPSNILICYDGNVKVADFGIAKAVMTVATQAGTLKGTAPYMSPEQCVGDKLDRRSDVFSLGTVLYEMATRRRLFKAENEYLTMKAVVEGAIPRPRTVRPDLPQELENIILKALAREPGARYQTAEQVGVALDQLAMQTGLRSSPRALEEYMKQLFGERLEPWLLPGDSAHGTLPIEFDDSVTGLSRPPAEMLDAAARPKSLGATNDSPIEHARRRVSTSPATVSATTRVLRHQTQPEVKLTTGLTARNPVAGARSVTGTTPSAKTGADTEPDRPRAPIDPHHDHDDIGPIVPPPVNTRARHDDTDTDEVALPASMMSALPPDPPAIPTAPLPEGRDVAPPRSVAEPREPSAPRDPSTSREASAPALVASKRPEQRELTEIVVPLPSPIAPPPPARDRILPPTARASEAPVAGSRRGLWIAGGAACVIAATAILLVIGMTGTQLAVPQRREAAAPAPKLKVDVSPRPPRTVANSPVSEPPAVPIGDPARDRNSNRPLPRVEPSPVQPSQSSLSSIKPPPIAPGPRAPIEPPPSPRDQPESVSTAESKAPPLLDAALPALEPSAKLEPTPEITFEPDAKPAPTPEVAVKSPAKPKPAIRRLGSPPSKVTVSRAPTNLKPAIKPKITPAEPSGVTEPAKPPGTWDPNKLFPKSKP